MADVFVGFYYDSEKADDLLKISRTGLSAAANQFQNGFLSGLPDAICAAAIVIQFTRKLRNAANCAVWLIYLPKCVQAA